MSIIYQNLDYDYYIEKLNELTNGKVSEVTINAYKFFISNCKSQNKKVDINLCNDNDFIKKFRETLKNYSKYRDMNYFCIRIATVYYNNSSSIAYHYNGSILPKELQPNAIQKCYFDDFLEDYLIDITKSIIGIAFYFYPYSSNKSFEEKMESIVILDNKITSEIQ